MTMLHSGFTTQQQEAFYNKLLEKAVGLLAGKLVEILLANAGLLSAQSERDLKFVKHLRKIYQYLSQMDKQKQMEPKFGAGIGPLYQFFKDNFDFGSDALSTATSNDSIFKGVGSSKLTASGQGNLASLAIGQIESTGARPGLDQINENVTAASGTPPGGTPTRRREASKEKKNGSGGA